LTVAACGVLALSPAAGASCTPLLQNCPTPAPPGIGITLDPSSVSNTSATLRGIVNPNGLATTYHFAYGRGNYATVLASAQLAAGYSDQQVSVTVTGLSPLTSYDIELVATNQAGTMSDAGTFETKIPAKPALKIARAHITPHRIVWGESVRISTSVYDGVATWLNYYDSPLVYVASNLTWEDFPPRKPYLLGGGPEADLNKGGRVAFTVAPDHNVALRVGLRDTEGTYRTLSPPVRVIVFPKISVTADRPFSDQRYVLLAYIADVHVLPRSYKPPNVYFYTGPTDHGPWTLRGGRRAHTTQLTNEESEIAASTRYIDLHGAYTIACVRHRLVRDMGTPFSAPSCGRHRLP
jgi:hypothetical protein